MILNIIRQTITEYNLFDKGDKVLIGLSGGADSVCLTHALWRLKEELGIELYTAHLNHGIRGAEALRDERFACEFSDKLGIRCFTKTVKIPEISSKTGESEESTGRKIRYSFFDELCKAYSIDKIATAHNKNDSAETIIMNFMRGSALAGLCGIPCKRGNITRPLINVRREDIETYCKENSLEHVTDSTNLTDDYTRNKIRHILIPLIRKEFNPNFINTVTDNSQMIYEDSAYIDSLADKVFTNAVENDEIQISKLLPLNISIARRVIRRMLKNVYGGLNNISSVYIDDILKLCEKHTGKSINLPDGVTARSEYGRLIISRDESTGAKAFEYKIKCGETVSIREINKSVTVLPADKRIKDGSIYLGCEGTEEIVVRNRRCGDKFFPYGMEGSKKIKEFFIDKKIPKKDRDLIPIVEINGKIASVGDRIDRNFIFRSNGIKIEFTDI